MKIHHYYRDSANINLNGSIVSFVPIIIIIWADFSYFRMKELLVLTIPFIIFSLASFQVYLFRTRQAQFIEKNMIHSSGPSQSLFSAKQFLVFFVNTRHPCLSLYFPDGYQAGFIKKYAGHKNKVFPFSKTFALYNNEEEVAGIFKVKGLNKVTIEVFDGNGHYLGCYQKRRISWLKCKKDFLDASDTFIGSVEGARLYMDEQIHDTSNRTIGRLQRGWMPVEWSFLFPEANTPVLSLKEDLPDQDKLLRISLLINEYFLER